MQESSNTAITIFGMKIPVPSGDEAADSGGGEVTSTAEMGNLKYEEDEAADKEQMMDKAAENAQQAETAQPDDGVLPSNNEEATRDETPLESNGNPKTPSIEEGSTKPNTSKAEKEQNEGTTSQEKQPLKKPDKILPCPRCNSMDTKFCYYNNYNVNQPRHFCKACQRYWTAGGTMRNVPVGAGRRKSKNSASHYRHISISEALQAAQLDVPNGTTHPALKTNGRVLNFGFDGPICESISSVLNLADKKVMNGTINGFNNLGGVPINGGKAGENGDDCSSGSSITVSNSMEHGGKNPAEPLMRNINGFPAQVPCLPGSGASWPYSWPSMVPPPAFCPSGYPMPFYPPTYWNCGVLGPWNAPWLAPQSASNQAPSSSSPSSPLGKHSRDGKMLKPDGTPEEEQPKQKTTNGCVLVPKTLRIDDPAEAAKSSIWATLGIKNESISGGGMFKGFESKKNENNHVAEPSPVLQANPAALSRSLNFQESV